MKRKLKLLIPLTLAVLIGVLVFNLVKQNMASAPSSPAKTTKQSTASKVIADNFDKTKYSLTDPASLWVVVNKQNPLQPLNYAPPDLTSVGGGQYMRSQAAKALSTLFVAANAQHLPMQAASGYRSYPTQIAVYNREVKTNGQVIADSESARPGYSEHQTGLAVDIAGGGCSISDCFARTKQGQWLANNDYKYGFIIRYPADKVAITGYRYEPWHIRYIGVELATEMHQQNVKTLEEFFGLPAAPSY